MFFAKNQVEKFLLENQLGKQIRVVKLFINSCKVAQHQRKRTNVVNRCFKIFQKIKTKFVSESIKSKTLFKIFKKYLFYF